MARYGGEEVVPIERVQLDVRRRAHRGRARHVAQKCDLAEVRAWALTLRRLPFDEHVDLSVADEVKAVSVVPAADDFLSFRRLEGHEAGCELLQHRRRERREDRNRTEQLQLWAGYRGRIESCEARGRQSAQD